MEKFEKDGIIHYSSTGFPRYKQYLAESQGVPLQTFWDDISNATGTERLGYPTQKPVTLLERIVKASSHENDIVLDAFCGCGTALIAAQLLKRQWIGIDISPTACRVMAKRLRDKCKLREDEEAWKAANDFIVPACFARKSATSASTAWVSSARAPLRKISVSESAKNPWLGELDDVTLRHGVSLLHWRSGGVEHHHDTPPYLVKPSPTSGYSSAMTKATL